MNLSQELADMLEKHMSVIPPQTLARMQKATEDLVASGIEQKTLKVEDTLPSITLPDANENQVNIQDLLKNGPVIICFYRGGWCPYCNIQLAALQKYLPEFQKIGAQLVAITPETPENSLNTQQKHNLDFLVLSDVGNVIAKELGLVFTLPEELRPIYKKLGIDIPSYNGDETFELPLPATFVVKTDGTVSYVFAKADYTKRAEPDDILGVLIS